MKKSISNFLILLAVCMCTVSVQAQNVNTLYFLENAPMRHTINPAFQPVSDFYLPLPVIGFFSASTGNDAFMLKDLYFNDPTSGNKIGALHPNAQSQVWGQMPDFFRAGTEIQFNLLSWGWRIRDFGYFHVNSSERIEVQGGLPNHLFGQMLNPGMENMDLSRLTAIGNVYSELALGYSHIINEKWTIGAKLKVLFGHAHASANFDALNLQHAQGNATLQGNGQMIVAGAMDPQWINGEISTKEHLNTLWKYLVPSGYGGAFDFGFTYKPIKQLQLSAAVTDLGFMHWNKANYISLTADTTLAGVGEYKYENYVQEGVFNTDSMLNSVDRNFNNLANSMELGDPKQNPLTHMMTAKLNIGLDANFWDNKVGVGVYSHTRFYNSYVTEEITLGAALRPCNWFNLAASYSFINGHWSNLGAAISLATYDGIMFTVAADYIPLSYAKATFDDKTISLPYKSNKLNVLVGVTIVTGTNRPRQKVKAEDIDNVAIAPVFVDSDNDGIADEFDKCPDTPAEAQGQVDSVGCPLDTDTDGVANYLDKCPDTPAEAQGQVDSVGCPLDTDTDGVANYLDKCPDTPAEAQGQVDSVGCPLDTDADGVADYLDKCPDTPAEAQGQVDSVGCPLDTDADGVADYLDKCPDTPAEAQGQVDSVGCPLDTDADGVANYEDICPDTPGEKSNKGCPIVINEVRNMIQKKMVGIEFDFAKADIRPESYSYLNQIAQTFIANPSYEIEIQGHTSSEGTYPFNMKLSNQRAEAVRNYLIKRGVPASMLTTKGFGPNKPIGDNATLEGRKRNRRVEFDITYEEVTRESVNDRVETSIK